MAVFSSVFARGDLYFLECVAFRLFSQICESSKILNPKKVSAFKGFAFLSIFSNSLAGFSRMSKFQLNSADGMSLVLCGSNFRACPQVRALKVSFAGEVL